MGSSNWKYRSAALSWKVYRSTGMTRDLVHGDIDFSILASSAANTERNMRMPTLSRRRFQYRRERGGGGRGRGERERKRAQRVNILSSAARVHISIRPAGFLLFRRPCSPVVTTRRADPIFDPRGTRWRKSRLSFLHTHTHIHTYTLRGLFPVPVAKRDFPSRRTRELAVETAGACQTRVKRTFPRLSHPVRSKRRFRVSSHSAPRCRSFLTKHARGIASG